DMVVRASLTGHLVLSTIHTNSAWGIISRLMDLGINPYLLSETVNLVLAQRLVRKLCQLCRIQESLPDSVKMKYGFDLNFVGKGCKNCHHTGFSGRLAVYELIEINEGLKNTILTEGSSNRNEIKSTAEDGIAKSALQLVR